MWGTPLGGPPRGPWGPLRGTRVSERSGKNCKKSQKLYRNYTCIKIPHIMTLTSILSHLGYWGGPWGGQNLQGRVGGGFSEARALVFFPNVLYRSIKEVLDGFLMIFLIHSFIDTPYSQCLFYFLPQKKARLSSLSQ